jgi:Domain of unknown function (DUF4355)
MADNATPTAPETSATTTEGADPKGASTTTTAEAGKTFTQADVDRIVSNRLARETEKFADYDQVKADAAELAKLRDGEKTELQKLQEQLAEELKTRSQVETELSSVKRTQYGVDKGLPLALAKRLTGQSEVDLDAEIEELKPFVTPAKPEPTKRAPTAPLRSGATGEGGTGSTQKTQAAEAIRRLMNNK